VLGLAFSALTRGEVMTTGEDAGACIVELETSASYTMSILDTCLSLGYLHMFVAPLVRLWKDQRQTESMSHREYSREKSESTNTFDSRRKKSKADLLYRLAKKNTYACVAALSSTFAAMIAISHVNSTHDTAKLKYTQLFAIMDLIITWGVFIIIVRRLWWN
jgi:hypothetical protein